MRPDFDFVRQALAPGLSVIEASAGTGKTYAISHLVPKLLLDGSATRLGEILLVTFTNDAARELSARVRRVLEKLHAPPAPDEELRDEGLHRLRAAFGAERVREVAGRALLDLDLLGVSTIHSFCKSVLQTEGTLCGLPTVPELIPDSDAIVEQVLRDHWESRLAAHALPAAIASAGKWEPGEDLAFLRTALPLEDFTPLPAAESFTARLEGIDTLRRGFTTEVCDELDGVLSQVVDWTQKAPAPGVRSGLAAALGGAAFFTAVQHAAKVPDWISGRNKAGKVLKHAAECCRAVELATTLVGALDAARWDFRIECLAAVRRATTEALAAARQITYDGLIGTLSAALRGPHAPTLIGRLRARFRVALIDESQDTDDRQFEIFRKIFVDPPESSGRLVLIGDPKQAIYAFRGADVNTYLAAKELAADRVYPLTRTFRSPEPLVRATNALFSREGSLLKEGLHFPVAVSGLAGDRQLTIDGTPDPARVECWIVPESDAADFSSTGKRNHRIAGAVASEIVRILKTGALTGDGDPRPVTPGDVAVLVSDGIQARAVAEALLERGVPAVRAGGDDIMASDEATELLTILRAVLEPRRAGLRHAALATRMLGVTASAIRALSESDDGGTWGAKFTRWQEVWIRSGVAAALVEMDADAGVTLRLAPLPLGERRVTNLRQLTDLLEAASHKLGRDPARLLRWFGREVAAAEARSFVDERQLRIESDAQAAKIVTMHSAKGLQYPLVFCPFLWSSKKIGGIRKLARKGDAPLLIDTARSDDTTLAALRRDALEDRLRLAYVAVTRAQVKVWILGGDVCGDHNPASALDWLLRTDDGEFDEAWAKTAGGKGRGARHLAGLEALVAASGAGDVLHSKPLPPTDDARFAPASPSVAADLEALEAPDVPSPWGLTSFSSLTRENDHEGPLPVRRDEPAEPGPNPFFDAPGGALVGTALHEWIERWDFTAPDPQALREHFAKFPIEAVHPPFAGRVGGMLEALREAVLPGLDCALHVACPDPAASEWHFQLPIADALGPDALAEVFARHGFSEYADALAALPSAELHGYLHGFLDRIAFHNGSWGVIDWKTNTLGKSPAAYDGAGLLRCACESHYLLQTHLYLVALRRFLGPDVPVSGAWLVFLRAVSPGRTDGILHIHPSKAFLDDLDALFARPRLPA